MDFLLEVLGSNAEDEVDLTDNNLHTITRHLSSHRYDINQSIDNLHKRYSQWPSQNEKLLSEATHLCEHTDNLKQNVEDVVLKNLQKQGSHVDSLKAKMQEMKASKNLVKAIIKIHEKDISFKESEANRNYVKAAHELRDMDALLTELPDQELGGVYQTLSKNISRERTSLIENVINNDLHELLIMKEGKSGVLQTNILKISKSLELREILETLKVLGVLQRELNLFNMFFWQRICKPIISNITIVQEHEDEDFLILNVSIKKTQLHRSYKEVFEKLMQVFQFIATHLDFEVEDDCKLISYLGNDLKLDFTEILLKDCLRVSLPTTDKDGLKYKQVIEDTNEFANKLIEIGFLKRDKNPILEYVASMNNLLANLRSEEYSVRATTIMKKDLHEMVQVGVHFDPQNPLTGDQFPQCFVSKSCVELLDLAQEILQQALLESDLYAARLICTMQSLFYQYGSIVYGHHEKLLANIPQQVVLFRNNCMYLAHQLTHLNECYDKRFSKEVLPVPPLFKDQPHQLRTVGGDTFLGYIEMHIKCMERVLVEFKFDSEQLAKVMNPDTSKSIRQCLRQYEVLKTVWHKILPHPVYNKTLGYLLNVFCKRLIDIVLNASDILVANAEFLIEMFKMILIRGPKLFTEPDEVNLYVELWQKLNELVFVLSANLVQITERWQHGPLSAHFASDEVKRLIKALFQNTDRRAQALSYIVDN